MREPDVLWGMLIGGLVMALVILGLVLGTPTTAEQQNALDRIETHGRGATHWSGQEWTR
jgi:hypothetical protein